MAEFSATQIEQIARNAAKNNLERYRQAIENYVVPVYNRGGAESELHAALYRASKEYHNAVNREIYYALPTSKASEAFLELERLAGRNTPNGAYFKECVRTKMIEANQNPDPETGLWVGTVFYYVVLTYLTDLQLPFEQTAFANELNQQQYQLERTVFSDIESYMRQRGTGQTSTPVQSANSVQPDSVQQPGYTYPGSTAQGSGSSPNGFSQSVPAYDTVATRPMGMKWYWFATNIQSFFTVLYALAYAVGYLTGSIYEMQTETTAATVYQVYPNAKVVDMHLGVVFLLLAVYALVVRHGLKKYYKNAPLYYMASYIISIVTSIIYATELSAVLGSSAFNNTQFIEFLFIAVLLILNYIYYRKRRHLFSNESKRYSQSANGVIIIIAIVSFFGIVNTFGTL